MKELEAGAICLEAECTALIWIIECHAFLRHAVEPTITDRAVDPAVWSEREAICIVAAKRNTHAEAILYHLALVCRAITIGVAERIELRNTGEKQGAFIVKHPGSSTIEQVFEIVCKHFTFVDCAIAIGVAEAAYDFRVFGHFLDGHVLLPLLMHRPSICCRLTCDVIEVPIQVSAVIIDAARAEAV